MRISRILILTLLLLFSAASLARADEAGPSLTVKSGYTGDADVAGRDGSVSVAHYEARGEWRGFSLGYGLDSYSWDNLSALPFGGGDKPWDELQKLGLSYTHKDMAWGDFGYFASLSGGAAFEDEFGGYSGGLGGGLLWRPLETLSLSLGARVAADARDTRLGPLFSLNWDGRDRDHEGFFASLGLPATQAGYSFDKTLTLRLAYSGRDDLYRLSDDSPVVEEGYVRIRDNKVGLFADWSPLEPLTISVGGQWEFDRRFDTYDDSGDHVSRYVVEDAPGVTCNVTWAF